MSDGCHEETHSQQRLFNEIRSKECTPFDDLPDFIECYISSIEPKKCGPVMKELGYLVPLLKVEENTTTTNYSVTKNSSQALTQDNEKGVGDGVVCPRLGHLRRIRRIVQKIPVSDAKSSQEVEDRTNVVVVDPPPKKRKNNSKPTNISLQILIGSVDQIDFLLSNCSDDNDDNNVEQPDPKGMKLRHIIQTYDLKLTKQTLPGRPAKSQGELETWKSRSNGEGWWPSLFFEKQTKEFKAKELELSLEDEEMMKNGLLKAIQDKQAFQKQGVLSSMNQDEDSMFSGAVVICPLTQTVVAYAFDEWNCQSKSQNTEDNMKLLKGNHLCTPILLAIQGVSRKERMAALGHGMDSDLFKNGQYLSTGYDLYTTLEPGIFEAMALVHSRIRRVIFGSKNHHDGGLGGTGEMTSVHSLPGTNHHYRAFHCVDEQLLQSCLTGFSMSRDDT